jgi:hypothetical protein
MLKGIKVTTKLFLLSETSTVVFTPGLCCQQLLGLSNYSRLATFQVRLFQALFYLSGRNIQQIKRMST